MRKPLLFIATTILFFVDGQISDDDIPKATEEPHSMLSCVVNVTMPEKNFTTERIPTQSSRPNILFVLSDQQRYDFDGLHPDINLEMPNFKRLTEEGVRFTSVFTGSPLCSPSRTCLALGRQYHQTTRLVSSFNNGPPPTVKTFYSSLRDSGYHTMTCGKDDLRKGDAQLGLGPKFDLGSFKELGFVDGERSLGKKNVYSSKHNNAVDQYGDFLKHFGSNNHYHSNKYGSGINVSTESLQLKKAGFDEMLSSYKKCMHARCPVAAWMPDEAQEDGFVGRKAIQLLRRRPKQQPFFLQVNFPSPHDPYTISPCMAKAIQNRKIGKPESEGRRSYAALCEIVDVWLGKIMDELEGERVAGGQGNALDMTLVCFSSDHGDLLGDGGEWGKQKPGQGSIAIPLACRGPRPPPSSQTSSHRLSTAPIWQQIIQGAIVTQPVSLIDLAATFLHIANAKLPSTMTSRSLLPVLLGEQTPMDIRPVVTSALGSWRVAIAILEIDNITSTPKLSSLARPALIRSSRLKENIIGEEEIVEEKRWVAIRSSIPNLKSPPDVHKWKVIDPFTNTVIDMTTPANKPASDRILRQLQQAFSDGPAAKTKTLSFEISNPDSSSPIVKQTAKKKPPIHPHKKPKGSPPH